MPDPIPENFTVAVKNKKLDKLQTTVSGESFIRKYAQARIDIKKCLEKQR